MPPAALALALGAAFLHALWNLLLARARDPEAATAVALGFGVVAFAPVAALTWRVEGAAVPFVAASACLELAYFALLAAAYRRAELSFVYPIARGLAPVLVLGGSVVALGASTSGLQACGVALVAAGVLLVCGPRRDGDLRDGALALAVAGCIAAYTVIDKQGVRHASPIPYFELVIAGPAAAYLAAVWRTGGGDALRRARCPATAAAGLAMFGAYALTLAALQIAPAAAVAAVRETSVVIATALAAAVLHERVSRARLLGAATVVAGIAALAAA